MAPDDVFLYLLAEIGNSPRMHSAELV